MKLYSTLTIFVISIFVISCGPNAEQKAALEKAKADSIAQVIEKAKSDAVENERKTQAKNDSLAAVTANDEAQKAANAELLIQDKADLAAAEEKMTDLKSFKLGRAKWEREEQIRQQAEIIERLKAEIKSIEGN